MKLAKSVPGAVTEAMVPEVVRVRQVIRETGDTITLNIAPPPRAGGFLFKPGQFNMLYAFGKGEVPISISGDPGHPSELLHTVRAVGLVTSELTKLQIGDRLGVRGPYGNGWPMERAKGNDLVIVAGGLGLAPLRPVIYHVLRQRGEFRRVALYYGARTPQDILFLHELEHWRGRLDLDLSVEVTVDRAGADWFGHVGVVTALLANAYLATDGTVAFVCGPEIMMRFAVRELERYGLARTQIWLSLERNMKCGVGLCGHCQYGPTFVCHDGPVYRLDSIGDLLSRREI
ncbi:MAG: FAD/NAD(P)-binding protein [Cyanobacteria bacterium NC_groundwater_1444_Ag_S-0.65um_54_12]|nr:FAD/NAD(P)-binding protein [Cyanobacteria bacterium NC_groundwater_1444_Ag_S-0.65um_54_12]